MKNILLSIIVIAAIVVAGLGGTLADFSDIEISKDNTFGTGALDLVVSNYLGQEFPNDAPKFYMIQDAYPGCDKSVFIDLHNYGQGFQVSPYCYLHIKNLSCGWVMPKKPFAWLDANGNKVDGPATPPAEGTLGTGYPRPVTEPEYVAEMGGVAGELADGTPVTVRGLGEYGETCNVSRAINVYKIEIAGPYTHDQYPTSADVPAADWTSVNLTAYDTDPQDGRITLNELVCHEILLKQIPNCNKIWMHMSLVLQDIDEDTLPAGNQYFDETKPAEAKWDHWPSNAIQKDFTEFDMAFELLETDYEPADPPPAGGGSLDAGGNPTVIECMWQTPDDGDPLHITPTTQVFPSVQYQADKEVQFWSVVAIPDNISTIGDVFADVYNPVASPEKGSLNFHLELARIDKATGMTALEEAYQHGLITFGAGFDFTRVMHELEQGLAGIFRGDAVLNYRQPAGDYRVEVKAFDINDNFSTSLTNFLTYIPIVAFEFDFTNINYGSTEAGVSKWIIGDTDFSTSESPTVRNIGNTNLQITLKQDDMGLGMTDGRYNVEYTTRFGTAELNSGFDPGEMVTLPGTLPLSKTERLDFSIHIKRAAPGSYSGNMTLTCIYVPFQ